MLGREVPRPVGTLAGHAGGLPFERLVHSQLEETLPGRCFRHYESLNNVLIQNSTAVTYEQRAALFGPRALQKLVMRGRQPTTTWTDSRPFQEKQDDTAETIVFPKPRVDFFYRPITLVDVKTQNLSRTSRAPNIISADKLAEAMKLSLLDANVDYDLVYVGIGWEPTATTLICKRVRVLNLFNIAEELYINWAAAQQVQFHPFTIDQDFTGSRLEWASKYLHSFCRSLEGFLHRKQNRLNEFQAALRHI